MKHRIVLLLQPHTNLLDLGGVAQVFQEAKAQGLDVTIEQCSSTDPVVTSTGLSLNGLGSFQDQEFECGDHIFVISADIHHVLSGSFRPTRALLEKLRSARDRGAGGAL